MTWFLILLVGLAFFVEAYHLYENVSISLQNKLPGGQPTPTIVIGKRDSTFPCLANVLFSADSELPPDELEAIASDIEFWLASGNPVMGSDQNEFRTWLDSQDPSNQRIEVPSFLNRGHEIWVAKTRLEANYLHPSWPDQPFVVCAIKPNRLGRLGHLPWNSAEAQRFYAKIHDPSPAYPANVPAK